MTKKYTVFVHWCHKELVQVMVGVCVRVYHNRCIPCPSYGGCVMIGEELGLAVVGVS